MEEFRSQNSEIRKFFGIEVGIRVEIRAAKIRSLFPLYSDFCLLSSDFFNQAIISLIWNCGWESVKLTKSAASSGSWA